MTAATGSGQVRREALRAQLNAQRSDGHKVDALVITDLVNLRYLTGFTGSNGALLVAADAAHDRIATDGRYTSQVDEQAPDLTAIIERETPGALLAYVVDTLGDGVRVGFEDAAMSVRQHQKLAADHPSVTLVGVGELVQELRQVKDEVEVEAIRMACQAADLALADLIARGRLRPGQTERQVARDLEWAMFERGAEALAFETIVATGANSAIPHHRPTDAELSSGDFVKIDFGAVVDGYHSDMTRTYVLEKAQDWQREIYDIVAQAQQAGREALAPDVAGREVDAVARSIIEEAGYGDNYVHGLGHGVGLQIHEAPGLGQSSTGTLPDGAAVTVEPGIYLPGRGGVRIEDTLIVRPSGPELLTLTDKAFTIV